MSFDIVSFCDDYGIPYAYRGKQISRGWIGVADVINKGFNDTDYHMGFNIAGGYLHSWVSGGVKLTDFIEAATPTENPYVLLRKYEGDFDLERLPQKRTHAESLFYPFPSLSDSKVGTRYLLKRGFDEKCIQKYTLGWGGETGEWAYRVILPLFHSGEIVTWQGRYICNMPEIPRYKTLAVEKSLVDPKSVLFNLNNCTGDTVVFCEGPLDVLKYGDGSCCSFGISVTESQLQYLSKYARVVVAFDPDAQEKAKGICAKLSALGVKEVLNLDLEDGDMGDRTQEQIQEIKALLCG